MSYDIPYLEKQPIENRIYTFDFTPNMAEDEAVLGIVSLTAAPAGLVITEQQFAGKRVQARIDGGADSTQYKLTVVVLTDDGNTLSLEGHLFVRDA